MAKTKSQPNHKSKINSVRTIKRVPSFNVLILVAVVIGLALLGYYLIFSRAASPNASIEPENATLAGNAAAVSDSSASGGKYVRFGQVSTGGGTTDPILPAVSGTCPTIQNGQVAFPQDSGRVVHFRMDSNTSTKGPLIFLWHGQATEDTYDGDADTIAKQLLLTSNITNYTNSGAVLAIMKMHTAGTWDNAMSWGASNRDLTLVDAVTACAAQQNIIDIKHIHSTGMSWGGYQTSHLAYLRSNYIASAVVMSGGFTGSPSSGAIQRPTNKFATITSLGTVSAGELNAVVGPLHGYRDFAKSNGQFVIECNHSGGHWTLPDGGPMQERFFKDHPYGTPNAYSSIALPSPPFTSICKKY